MSGKGISAVIKVKGSTEQSGMIHHLNESSIYYVLSLYEKGLKYFGQLMLNFLIILASIHPNCVIFLYRSVLEFLIWIFNMIRKTR